MQIRQYTVTSEKSERSGQIGTGSHYEVAEESLWPRSPQPSRWEGFFSLRIFFPLTFLRFNANIIRYFVL